MQRRGHFNQDLFERVHTLYHGLPKSKARSSKFNKTVLYPITFSVMMNIGVMKEKLKKQK